MTRPPLWPLALVALAGQAHAQTADPAYTPQAMSSRLLATAGVVQIDGAGGGGLVPWATIAGYGTDDQVGVTAHDSVVHSGDFTLNSTGLAVGAYDRVELSYAHSWFYTGDAGARLDLGRGYQFALDVVGAKLRLFGNLVYDQASWLPQVAVGAQMKWADAHAVIRAIGGSAPDGADFYVAATKLFLAQSLLVDVTVRATRANQLGLLGFGGDGREGYRIEPEASAAYLLTRRLALGAEIRDKPDDLRFAREDAAFDAFAAFFLNKHASATLAYLDLGHVARQGVQNGVYLSLAVGF